MPRRIVLILLSLTGTCCIVPLFLIWFVDTNQGELETLNPMLVDSRARVLPRRKALDFEHDPSKEDIFDLNMQIEELENIKSSVRNELRELDGKRWELMKEVAAHSDLIAKLRKEIAVTKRELGNAKNDVAKVGQGVALRSSTTQLPIIILPQLQNVISNQGPPPLAKSGQTATGAGSNCTLHSCFDFSLCPLTRKFDLHIYNTDQNVNIVGTMPNENDVKKFLTELKSKDLLATNPSSACLHVLVIGKVEDSEAVAAKLKELEYWKGSGINHLIIEHPSVFDSQLHQVNTGHAIVGSAHHLYLRKKFDIFSAPAVTNADGKFRELLPLLLSTSRQKLLYFHGECQTGKKSEYLQPLVDGLLQLKEHIVDVDIRMSCDKVDVSYPAGDNECNLCGSQVDRFSHLAISKFALIPELPGLLMFVRVIEALRSGSVPVILGTDFSLPFEDKIDWELAVLQIPLGHFSQIHLILKSIEENDLQQFNLQGRFLYETYFRSPQQIMSTILAMVQSYTLHPAPAIADVSFLSVKHKKQLSASSYISMPSALWRHNYTQRSYNSWNKPPGPFYSFPNSPKDPVPLSGSQYTGMTEADLKQLPPHIILAGGITGPYFEDYLLGNVPSEQFTVVVLTYQRNAVMIEAVERLSGLPHLHKVIVVWNNAEDISSSITMPNIDVPVEFIKVPKNSLNNRFIPYDAIETEAILSVDDDVYLRHDEIQFGFRVWREARDRIVGFPGRFHSFDVRSRQWLYNSNYTCELSMVLTGAAFYHKVSPV